MFHFEYAKIDKKCVSQFWLRVLCYQTLFLSFFFLSYTISALVTKYSQPYSVSKLFEISLFICFFIYWIKLYWIIQTQWAARCAKNLGIAEKATSDMAMKNHASRPTSASTKWVSLHFYVSNLLNVSRCGRKHRCSPAPDNSAHPVLDLFLCDQKGLHPMLFDFLCHSHQSQYSRLRDRNSDLLLFRAEKPSQIWRSVSVFIGNKNLTEKVYICEKI